MTCGPALKTLIDSSRKLAIKASLSTPSTSILLNSRWLSQKEKTKDKILTNARRQTPLHQKAWLPPQGFDQNKKENLEIPHL
ncbi:hypothetical protein L6452_02659 [Arctium lappa]|uniref:Uncharacterized protein n=1 Tax=Arctium lappa TaxID=4217 RepID=A0ACB9FJN9_ARCLA|nr:hypothetical protein L6452_02659 [Arctium lappa]